MITELLTLGNELLDGRRIDTNSAWIGRFLAGHGLEVRYRQTTQDRKEDIVAAFRLALHRSDLIISTGGLGPTQDDITFESLAESLNVELEYHPDIFAEIQKRYEKRNLPCPISNKRQAMLPKGATPIPAVGTAPGCFMTVGSKMIFCFPGVPHEMQTMVESFFIERIREKLKSAPVFQQGYSVSGIGESAVEERLMKLNLEKNELAEISIAYTASVSLVDVTFSVKPHDQNHKTKILESIDQAFRKEFESNLVKWNEKTIEEHIVEWFLNRKWKLGVAESITGGLITSSLVNVPGCSEVLDRGLVTYSYSSKMELLGVSESTLAENGAVSPECVLEMARGLRKKSGVDVAVSICGIAGPGGATPNKPLGLTYICWVGPPLEMEKGKIGDSINYVKSIDFSKKVGPQDQNPVMFKNKEIIEEKIFNDELGLAKVQGFVFTGDRKRNRLLAANQALMGLYSFLRMYK